MSNFDYLHIRGNVITSHYPDLTTSVWTGADWEDTRNEVRRILDEDFYALGTVSDDAGNMFVVNCYRLRQVARGGRMLLCNFRDGGQFTFVAVTEQIAKAHERYLRFIMDANDLDRVKLNRNVKIIAQGATQSDFVFPTFASLQGELSEGDYVIVTPGDYELTEAFYFKNGVDIENQRGADITAQYGDTTIQHAIFTDHENAFGNLGAPQREDIARTTKIIKGRIFGQGTFTVADCPSDRFMPLLKCFYSSSLSAMGVSLTSESGWGANIYSVQGHTLSKVKSVSTQRLIDNDYKPAIMDVDILDANMTSVYNTTFFPAIDGDVQNATGIVRNANITRESDGQLRWGIESGNAGVYTYHYINVKETDMTLWLNDELGGVGCNVYAHNYKLETDTFSSEYHYCNWYNNGFTNYRNNSDGDGLTTVYHDTLITT